MNLFCVGLSHCTAALDTRERFAGHARTVALLRAVGCTEALVLTTCNRVEVYAASEGNVATRDVAGALQMVKGNAAEPMETETPFYRHDEGSCIEHLFRVSSGLDSMVVGETEILGQTKRAYEQAQAAGQVGPVLHRLFQRAFRVAKQVRSKTQITRGSISVGSVAVDLAEKIFGDLRGRKVLVLGAGETSEKTLRALASRGVSDLRVSNRTAAHAEELAARFQSVAIPFSNWLEQCREIDILISSTAAEAHLLKREELAPMLRERLARPLFIIDIAVPRDVAPEVNDLEGVYLYDIDSLQAIAAETLALRRQEFAAAESIIAQHLAEFRFHGVRRSGDETHADPHVTATLRASEL